MLAKVVFLSLVTIIKFLYFTNSYNANYKQVIFQNNAKRYPIPTPM